MFQNDVIFQSMLQNDAIFQSIAILLLTLPALYVVGRSIFLLLFHSKPGKVACTVAGAVFVTTLYFVGYYGPTFVFSL